MKISIVFQGKSNRCSIMKIIMRYTLGKKVCFVEVIWIAMQNIWQVRIFHTQNKSDVLLAFLWKQWVRTWCMQVFKCISFSLEMRYRFCIDTNIGIKGILYLKIWCCLMTTLVLILHSIWEIVLVIDCQLTPVHLYLTTVSSMRSNGASTLVYSIF